MRPLCAGALVLPAGAGRTQEAKNELGRAVQNWTGTDGLLDRDPDGVVDPGEKKVYFEFSDYSTPYVFYENPR